jgi:hypothetical protein
MEKQMIENCFGDTFANLYKHSPSGKHTLENKNADQKIPVLI